MDTTALKNFATAARIQLLKEVNARLGTVLHESSVERREYPAAISQLEKAVHSEGAGLEGRRKVAERVAYTWFNRIVALRFMDANSYTDVGVVSPAVGQTVGQPEVLAEAKRGHIDDRIVTKKATADRIAGLLNGTLTSGDPQREAYGVLLTAYCRHWNHAMPFMFEPEGDYTELLMPADLLSDESVIATAVSVLTAEVCEDVEVIGWLYQFYIAERKDEVFAGFKKGMKAGVAEIPAATQLFTPHWIVRYLVENSLGRLWLLNRPESKLVQQMEYYIAPAGPVTNYLRIASPEELKILDPACGSGHMLTFAFDLLYAIYEEEGYAPNEIPGLILANNLYGIEIDMRAGALAAFALVMKARARQRTFLAKAVPPNICVLESICFTPSELDALVSRDGDRAAEEEFFNQFADADTFGSLIRPRENLIVEIGSRLAVVDETDLFVISLLSRASRVLTQAKYLSSQYHVAVVNPPYMGSGNMSAKLSEWAKREWPSSKSDMFAMFIERSLQLTISSGFVAMITMHSWMFLASYKILRKKLLETNSIESMAHLGTGAFDSIAGEVVATTSFVVRNSRPVDSMGVYIRLVEQDDEAAKSLALREAVKLSNCTWRYDVPSQRFAEIPGSLVAYWLSDEAIHGFTLGVVGDHARSEGAVKTGNNSRYLRRLWEIDREKTGDHRCWRLHPKGGGFRRWYGNVDTVVDWSEGSRTHYRDDHIARIPSSEYWNLPGITWSSVSTSRASFRVLTEDEIANNAALFIFLDNPARTYAILGYLNSDYATEYLEAIAPTINYLVGDVMALPLPDRFVDEELVTRNVESLINAARADWDENELSYGFSRSAILSCGGTSIAGAVEQWDKTRFERDAKMQGLEDLNEAVLLKTFGHIASPLVPLTLDDQTDSPVDRNRDAIIGFISYAIGCLFGRYSLDKPGLILANQGDTLHEFLRQVPQPSLLPDEDNVIPILDDDWFDDDIVERFRKFLRITFGDKHFEENLRFIEGALGKDLRKYFVTDFYKDHVQRYKKRPIYWMFSSPKGSFNTLIYMHRYNPSTVSRVLNEYLREFQAKLRAELGNQERISGGESASMRDRARAEKEIDKIRRMLLEVEGYEHDVLYPLATQQITIDLDDGVKINYPKFGAALKKIPGLEAASD